MKMDKQTIINEIVGLFKVWHDQGGMENLEKLQQTNKAFLDEYNCEFLKDAYSYWDYDLKKMIKVEKEEGKNMKDYKKCPYYNGHYCTSSYFQQSFCIGKCEKCTYTIEDYRAVIYSEMYKHLVEVK